MIYSSESCNADHGAVALVITGACSREKKSASFCKGERNAYDQWGEECYQLLDCEGEELIQGGLIPRNGNSVVVPLMVSHTLWATTMLGKIQPPTS